MRTFAIPTKGRQSVILSEVEGSIFFFMLAHILEPLKKNQILRLRLSLRSE
jgi:hypothetical protein